MKKVKQIVKQSVRNIELLKKAQDLAIKMERVMGFEPTTSCLRKS